MAAPASAYRYLATDPSIRGGAACVEGTRIGVHDVVGLLQNGETVDSIGTCFPQITRAQVYECLAYYEDHRGEIDLLIARQMASAAPQQVRFLFDNDVPDTVARVLREAGHDGLLLRNVMPARTADAAVFEYAAAHGLMLVTCNRDHFIPLARDRAHPGLIVLIRRRSRIAECANLLRLVDSATESGLAGNINFA